MKEMKRVKLDKKLGDELLTTTMKCDCNDPLVIMATMLHVVLFIAMEVEMTPEMYDAFLKQSSNRFKDRIAMKH